MRDYVFHGKRVNTDEWVEGHLGYNKVRKQYYIMDDVDSFPIPVHQESVGQYTGMNDKSGRRIFEGDIVQHQTYDGFDCQSVVKFGVYTQDGSGGEYTGKRCLGFYVDVNNFTCPDWCEDDPSCFGEYLYQQNINEVAAECKVIGTVFENTDLFAENAELKKKYMEE